MDPFKKIALEDKEKLLKRLESQTFTIEKGKPLTKSITTNQIFGILIKGKLQIVYTSYQGATTIIDEIRENGIFGTKLSFLDDREFSLIAKEDSEVLIMDYLGLINYIQDDSPVFNQFTRNLFEISVNMIQERNNRIKVLAKKSIRDRLLEFFSISQAQSGSRTFILKTSYTELAGFLGVDRAAMSRELKNLKDDGLIETRGRRITIKY